MLRNYKSIYLLFALILTTSVSVFAQVNPIRGLGDKVRGISGGRGGGGGTDSLRHRDKMEDSVTISFRYLDSTRNYKLDSSISDFTRRYPMPPTYVYLGNIGNAAKSLVFSPTLTAGFDPGFQAFDIYKWKLEKMRFFNTTRPYSELNYQLGSRVEQVIEIIHTQNIRPNWNILFQYRLINAPGFYKNQKTNHNNYIFNSWFQSKNKRYNNYFALLANKLQSAESGGMKDSEDFLHDPIYKDRFNIDTKIGGDDEYSANFFSNKISTGNKYSEFTLLLRQQYDLGRKDSFVTDSTVIPLFYPRLRFEYNLTVSNSKYIFIDQPRSGNSGIYYPDSTYYKNTYGLTIDPGDTVQFRERWTNIINDFSIYQFPDAKNLQQFIKLGASIQNLTGKFTSDRKGLYNVFGHAEYRNKTRDQKWDIEANGKLYFAGLNAGDYQAYASLQRLIGKKLGYIQLGFENVNRTPSFLLDSRSSFYLLPTSIDFKKENTTHLFASYFLPSFQLRLTGNYYLLTNYTYLTDYYKWQQDNSLFNILQIGAEKTFKLSRHWNWHTENYLQQVVGNGPVHVPLIYSRNRVAYEGSLGFKSLNIAMGVEVRYRSPYKADGYSPVLGQFFFQDSIKVSNHLPDLAAYMHFRIRSFKAFVRAENLNTASTKLDGFGFTNNSIVIPGYAMPGLQIKVGIYWGFVN